MSGPEGTRRASLGLPVSGKRGTGPGRPSASPRGNRATARGGLAGRSGRLGGQRLENWKRLRAPGRPYFLRSTARASRVTKPAFLRMGR